MKKIAIIGMGVVGTGMYNLFKDHFEIVPYGIDGDKNAVNQCDLAIICVPTPSKEDGSCDTSIVESIMIWLECPVATHSSNCSDKVP